METPAPRPVAQVCAGLSDLLGPASQIVVVGQRDSEEEYATEEEEDGSVWQGAQFHQSDGGHCNRQVYKDINDRNIKIFLRKRMVNDYKYPND